METLARAEAVKNNLLFIKAVQGLGDFSIRAFSLEHDIPLIHEWVNQEYAKYWMLQNTTMDFVQNEYEKILSHSDVFIGQLNGDPAFLMERYKASLLLSAYYDVEDSDYGMHVLVAPPTNRIHNFTWNVFTVIMDFLFADPRINRVVVEPDVRNEKIHTLNKRAGFEYQKTMVLPHKTAYLAFCTREQYQIALQQNNHFN